MCGCGADRTWIKIALQGFRICSGEAQKIRKRAMGSRCEVWVHRAFSPSPDLRWAFGEANARATAAAKRGGVLEAPEKHLTRLNRISG